LLRGLEVALARTVVVRDGAFELLEGIPVGSYLVRFWVSGSEPFEAPVTFSHAGARVELTARLDPHKPTARLVLTWLDADEALRRPLVRVRPLDGSTRDWVAPRTLIYSDSGMIVIVAHRLGRHEVFALERGGTRFARAAADDLVPADVSWVEGRVIELRDRLAEGECLRALRVAAGGDPLPLHSPEALLDESSVLGRETKLGPYPTGLGLTLEGTRVAARGEEAPFFWAID
jgi:hypothetical protein